jgi:hypothetical protein
MPVVNPFPENVVGKDEQLEFRDALLDFLKLFSVDYASGHRRLHARRSRQKQSPEASSAKSDFPQIMQ